MSFLKKILRSSFLVFLCVILIAATVGCKGKGDNNLKDPNSAISGELGLKLPTYDFGGNTTVKVLTYYDIGQEVFDMCKEAYGLDIDLTKVAQGDVKLKFINSVLAGNDPYDLANGIVCTPASINKKIVASFDDIIDLKSDLWKSTMPTNDITARATNGKYYVLSPAISRKIGVWYNKELFEEYGVKNPKEYLAEDNWTLDTMREIAKKMTVDTDNDGANDVWGISFDNPWDMLIPTGGGILSYDENGVPSNALKGERVSRLMNYYQGLQINDRVVCGDGVKMFSQGKLAMFYADAWHGINFPDLLTDNAAGIVPNPRDVNADKYYVGAGGYGYSLSSNAKNPNGAAAVLSCMRFIAEEKDNQQRKGNIQPVESFQGNTECNEMYAELNLNFEKYTGITIPDFVFYDLLSVPWPMFYSGLLDGQPWSAVAESLSPVVENAIEKANDMELTE